MSPAQIQAEIARIGNNEAALRAFLQSLSSAEYNAWSHSPERINSIGAGTAETILGPAAGLVGAGALGVAGTLGLGRLLGIGIPTSIAGGAIFGGDPLGVGDGAQNQNVPMTAPEDFDGIESAIESAAAAAAAQFMEGMGYVLIPGTNIWEHYETKHRTTFEDYVAGVNPDPERGIRSNGSSGSSRFLFPEEQLALQQENEINRRILAGELGWQEVQPGFWIDPITGESYDENDVEVAREQIAESARQHDTTFEEEARQFGLTFEENKRQFDTTLAFDRELLAEDSRQFGITESRLLEGMRRERGLAENQEVANILRNPADFLARAFLQRGVESPLQQITQADLVGSLRNAISGASGGQIVPGTTLPGGQAQMVGGGGSRLFNEQAYQQAQQEAQNAAVAQSGVTDASIIANTQLMNDANARAGTGITGAQQVSFNPAAQVGDAAVTSSRLPTPQETAAAIAQFNTLQQTGQLDPGQAAAELSRFMSTPISNSTAIAPVDREQFYTNAPVQQQQGYQPGGLLGGVGSQQDIINMARQYSPPAVNAAIDGTTESLPSLNLGFSAPTPRQLSRLTGAETEALGTRLGAEFNTTLPDLADQQRMIFGKNRSQRKSRLVV